MSKSSKESRVCLLTGAGGVLGAELCKTIEPDYLLSAVCRRQIPEVDSQEVKFINPLKAGAAAEGTRTFIIRADLADEDEIERIIELTLARFGKIDLLVNSAVHYSFGSLVEDRKLLEEASLQFELNTLAPLRLAVTAARMFWRQRRRENLDSNRNIINLSSISAREVYEDHGQSIYSATKAALECLTRHMAQEFSKFGVRVNAVAPTTFPALIPTSRVVDEILRLDAGSQSGEIIVISS
jgi:NAD(P)-dependent dehydrogenase (short-subunit alcohol dehydrogenase family)